MNGFECENNTLKTSQAGTGGSCERRGTSEGERGASIPAGVREGLFDGLPMWQGDAIGGLRAPIGWTAEGQRVFIALGSDGARGEATHALVGGAIGSGKTVLVDDIIHSLAYVYGPDELEILHFDFKGGIGMGRYLDEDGEIWLPHIGNSRHGIPAEANADTFCEVLEAEIERRRQWLGQAGVGSIREYGAQGGRMKRVLVVVEDFQELFFQGAARSERALGVLRAALKAGRGSGLHLVLTTQTMAWAKNAFGGAVEKSLQWIGLRFALFGMEADGILAGDNRGAASRIQPKQEAIMNPDFGKAGANTVFHFPFAGPYSEEEERFRRRVKERVGEA